MGQFQWFMALKQLANTHQARVTNFDTIHQKLSTQISSVSSSEQLNAQAGKSSIAVGHAAKKFAGRVWDEMNELNAGIAK